VGKNRERWRRRIPATPVTGGEGDVGELKEETEPHPLVPVARRERVGGGRSAVDSEAAAEALVGDKDTPTMPENLSQSFTVPINEKELL